MAELESELGLENFPQTQDQAKELDPVGKRLLFRLLFGALIYAIYKIHILPLFTVASTHHEAMQNGLAIVHLEKYFHVFAEPTLQHWLTSHKWTTIFVNFYYNVPHFVVTIGMSFWLFYYDRKRFNLWLDTLLIFLLMSALTFAFYPVMPPRLLDACSNAYGACYANINIISTLNHYFSFWNYSSPSTHVMANIYASTPSMHIGMAFWCLFSCWPKLKHRATKVTMFIYPFIMIFAVMMTGTHFFLDALIGMAMLGIAYLITVAIKKPGRISIFA